LRQSAFIGARLWHHAIRAQMAWDASLAGSTHTTRPKRQ
jgi:hypothetical protein